MVAAVVTEVAVADSAMRETYSSINKIKVTMVVYSTLAITETIGTSTGTLVDTPSHVSIM